MPNNTGPMAKDNMVGCPFPHEVKRGVFLEIDTEDFGFVRVSCSDCGCAGPYVALDSLEGATDAEKTEAVTLWNTRATMHGSDSGVTEADVLRVALAVERADDVRGKPEGTLNHPDVSAWGEFVAREAIAAMSSASAPDSGALREALELIADESSWRGFSPAPIVERMRDVARAALNLSSETGERAE